MKDAERRTGRPLKEASPGERASLGLKVTPEIKARIDEAARANGRTQSQEAEVRLERTFREDDLLPQLLDAKFGKEFGSLLIFVGHVMSDVGETAAVEAAGPAEVADHWLDHPWAYQQAMAAAVIILKAFVPPGEIDRGAARQGWYADMGDAFAHVALGALLKDPKGKRLHPRELAERTRAGLGDRIERIAKLLPKGKQS